MSKQDDWVQTIIAYLGMGFAIVIMVVALIFVSYLLFWGGLVGLVIFAIVYLKNRFFPRTNAVKRQEPHRVGRVFDQDDFK